ncbi:MAG: cyclase family protein, partial [Dehalococcoidia bacterium]
SIDFSKLPKFSELPVKPGAPPDSNWGVFGDDDQLGCVNFLTEEGVLAATRLVRKGKVFRLDTPIGYADPPLFERSPARHTISRFPGFLAHDDKLDDYNTQEGSQWDGLGHVGHPDYDAFYNGVKPEEIKSGPEGKLGIHLWANKMVGRGVLLDVFKYRNDQGRPLNPGATEEYTVEDLEGAAKAQGVEVRPGNILLVRTGWLQHYLKSPPEEKKAMGSIQGLQACGIDHGREMAAWLWDHRVAALGTDCPAVETWPWKDFERDALHYRTLPLLGLPIGEQFDLEELAGDCTQDGVWECMLVSVPLYLVGGIASPPNAVAIK